MAESADNALNFLRQLCATTMKVYTSRLIRAEHEPEGNGLGYTILNELRSV